MHHTGSGPVPSAFSSDDLLRDRSCPGHAQQGNHGAVFRLVVGEVRVFEEALLASFGDGSSILLLYRWEQIAIIILFLFLRRKGSIFERKPKLAVAFVVAVLTVTYSLIAMLPGSGIVGFMRFAKGANTIAKFNNIQAHFGFPLVMVPKIIMDISGELLRPGTYFAMFKDFGFGDIHSWFIVPAFSLVLIPLLAIAYYKGLLNPRRPMALLIIIYLLVVALTPRSAPLQLLCLRLTLLGIS